MQNIINILEILGVSLFLSIMGIFISGFLVTLYIILFIVIGGLTAKIFIGLLIITLLSQIIFYGFEKYAKNKRKSNR